MKATHVLAAALLAVTPTMAMANCPSNTIHVGLSGLPTGSVLYFNIQFVGKPLLSHKTKADSSHAGVTFNQWIFDHKALDTLEVIVFAPGQPKKKIDLTKMVRLFEYKQLPAWHRQYGAQACVRTTLEEPYTK